jgi:transposase
VKKEKVQLTAEQKQFLTSFVTTGVRSARAIRRARTFLLADQGVLQKHIATQLGCSEPTIVETLKRYRQYGGDVAQALLEKPRSGQPTKITPEIEAHITVMACDQSGPDGRGRWNLRLMAERLVELEFIESISSETVRQVLKKANSNPGRKSSGASAK